MITDENFRDHDWEYIHDEHRRCAKCKMEEIYIPIIGDWLWEASDEFIYGSETCMPRKTK